MVNMYGKTVTYCVCKCTYKLLVGFSKTKRQRRYQNDEGRKTAGSPPHRPNLEKNVRGRDLQMRQLEELHEQVWIYKRQDEAYFTIRTD